ncbi:MAG: ParB/RepB/Spo0J family partition protein [Oscillospiraceae bacterium]|nr:ParB/RepB/Spo0J family partition protein [Oscillospiraceae bacterium]
MSKAKITGNLALVGYNDIFNTSTPNIIGEQIVEIPLCKLYPPEFHPFQVNDDETMQRLVQSVKQYGVREPGLARPRANGGYELLCGNRRKRACELADIATMPVIVRELNDDEAVIALVDSNLERRETLLYSEKAWAYRVKLEALNHRGAKSDTPGQLSVDILCEQTGESKNQIFRLVRLTELIAALIDKVDAKQLAFNPAVELSYLSISEQTTVAEVMAKYDVKPSLSQAVRLKKMKHDGTLTLEAIDSVLSAAKKPQKGETTEATRFRRYFPTDYTPRQMEKIINDLLRVWQSEQAKV